MQKVYALLESVEAAAARMEKENGEDLEESAMQYRRKLAQCEALKQENPDVAGWLEIEGTVISYPVMYTPQDPDYYLYRNFQKEKSAGGSIYMDGACKPEKDVGNLLLYGHHMRNGDMFASLVNYADPVYEKEYPEIRFVTPKEISCYQIMAVFGLPAEQVDEEFMEMLRAGSKEAYKKLLEFMEEHRLYDTGVRAHWPEQLMILATCEYTRKDGRFFVAAKRKV